MSPGMELIVLGSGGGWARAGGAACGYLVRHGDYTLWLDAGTGTMGQLQKHCALRDVDGVVVSHRHFDHFLDLYPYYLALAFDPERSGRIPLFAPPGMFEHALQIEDDLPDVFDSRVVEPGHAFDAGPFRITTKRMAHPVPTLGMRIEAGGSTLAYSADTGPCDELVSVARGAELLLSEATWLQPGDRWGGIHLTAEEAGQHAARAGAGTLILTHIWPALDREASREQAARWFGGTVGLAIEGEILDVEPGGPAEHAVDGAGPPSEAGAL
jgi:ribonuclease BN (tRNA processing enzyme)